MKDDTISRAAAIDALDKVAEMFPYRIPGKPKTYRQYNEAWGDAVDAAENAIEALPSAQPSVSKTETVEDCISRAVAIDAFLTELTKRERKNFLHTWSTVEVKYFVADMLEKLPPAQPGCEDAVSRADVDILIEEAQTAWLRGDILLMYPTLKKGLKKVPPVTPKQPEPMMLHVNCDLSKEEYEKLMNDIGKQSVVLLPQEKEQRWIPWDSGKFPEESGTYTVTAYDGTTKRVTYAKYQKRLKRWELTGARAYWRVLAWQPKPEPWEGGQDDSIRTE